MRIEEVATLPGHTSAAWGVAFHPTDPVLASCSGDKSIRMYGFTKALDGRSFQHICTLPSSHNRTVRQIAFSPDGKRMASASFDSTVGIWERTGSANASGTAPDSEDDEDDRGEEWENVGSLEGHESEVKAVAWSYNGDLLATCGRDKSVWIWDANSADDDFECLAVLMDHTQDVKHVTFSPKEEILASSSYDDTVKLYAADYTSDEWMVTHSLPPAPPKHYHFPNDTRDPEPDESRTGHASTVWASAFSPDGEFIASCSDDLTIRIWARFKRKDVKGEPGGAFRIGRTEKEGWTCVSVLKGYHERTIFSLDWTDVGSWKPDIVKEGEKALGRLVTVGGDGKICVLGITATPSEDSRSGVAVHTTLLASFEQAHGVYDINHVQWCRLGRFAAQASDAAASKRDGRPAQDSNGRDEDDMDFEESAEAAADRKESTWRTARDMFATAGDDGSVKVWLLQNEP